MIMKKQILFSLLFCLCLPPLLSAHPRNAQYKRTVSKNFNVDHNAQLSISNKYGKIVLHTWDKNQIQATIVITGFGKDQDEAQRIANTVNIEAGQSGNSVTLKTDYDPRAASSSFWSRLFSAGSGEGKEYVNIDYEVYLPKSLATLNIRNNYGDVISDDLFANTTINISYCGYHLGSLSGNLRLDMNYSKGSIEKTGPAVVSANYSNLRSDDMRSLKIGCNYTDLQLGKVGTLSVSATYGNIAVDEANEISGSSDYTDYKIGKLNNGIGLKVTYGDVKIATLAQDFKQIYFEGSYSGLKLGLPDNASFRIDAHIAYGDINKGGFSFRDVNSVESGKTRVFKAVSSRGNENSPLIRFNGAYSDLTLMQGK